MTSYTEYISMTIILIKSRMRDISLPPNPRIDNWDLKFINLYIIASTTNRIIIKNQGKCKTDDKLDYYIK